MISHEHRCIFVHIPRTAGSSIEEWICGEDWWHRNSATKHMTAHQTRTLYEEHWNDYFTFSFVRNPWKRMASCLQFPEHFGVKMGETSLDFAGYEERFGAPITLEIDHRFSIREEVLRPLHQPGAVYGNLLDEALDFVGRFESIETDIAEVASALGITTPFASHLKPSHKAVDTSAVFDHASDQWIRRMFSRDLVDFGYDGPAT